MTTYNDAVKYASTIIAKDVKLSRMTMIQRITMIAAAKFAADNHFTLDSIEDEDRANHYGVKVGTTRKVSKKLSQLPVNIVANIVLQCNKEVKKIYK